MRNLILCFAACGMALSAAPLASAEALASDGRLIFGVEPVAAPPIEDVQFLFGGRNYCWYPGGWRGPGYYWCGYAYRRGLGWGGPAGWHGWRSGGRSFGHGGAGPDHGGQADPHHGLAMTRGAPGGGHGGGDHGGGDHGGGGHEGGHTH